MAEFVVAALQKPQELMKTFLTNLLIIVSLGLCILIWHQWVREGKSRQEIQALTDTIHDRDETIQSLQVTLRRNEAEIARLDELKNQLKATVQSNSVEIIELRRELDTAKAELEKQTRLVDAYKDALEQANESIKKQNEDVLRQNEEMKKLAEERNEIVLKYNKLVEEFNELANKWNALQETLAKTNQPAPRK